MAVGDEGRRYAHEVEVSGSIAFMRSSLVVTVQPPGVDPMERTGQTLTVFRKIGGRWLLARDANLLVPKERSASGEKRGD